MSTLLKGRLAIPKSLYSLLESVPNEVRGQKIKVIDGQIERQFQVEKYERFKAGLMGRVWVKRLDQIKTEQPIKNGSILVSDVDALGLKWQLIK